MAKGEALKGPPVFSVDVRNFVVVTFLVPAERIERQLPTAYELETSEGPEGRRAFISTTCFCNRDFRSAQLPYPRHTFDEITYRTYVNGPGGKGVYFFGRYLGTQLAWASQRPIARDTYAGDFDIAIDSDDGEYRSYACSATSSVGRTEFEVTAAGFPSTESPFESVDELTQFLTYRLNGYFTTSAGSEGHMPVEHPRMRPLGGSLVTGRFDLWSELGILTESEVAHPHSVLVEPQVPFKLFAPRPVAHQGST